MYVIIGYRIIINGFEIKWIRYCFIFIVIYFIYIICTCIIIYGIKLMSRQNLIYKFNWKLGCSLSLSLSVTDRILSLTRIDPSLSTFWTKWREFNLIVQIYCIVIKLKLTFHKGIFHYKLFRYKFLISLQKNKIKYTYDRFIFASI